MCLHIDGGPVARGHAYIAARILNLDGGIRGNLCVQHLLVAVVFGQAEGVEEVVALVAEVGAEGAPPIVPPGSANAQDGEQNQNTHKASATAHRGLALQVERPLAQQGEAGADQ